MNICVFTGRLGSDPTVQKTPKNRSMCAISLAVKRHYKPNEKTDWIPLVLWDKLAENLEKYGYKGMHVMVVGTWKTRTYTSNGKTHTTSDCYVQRIEYLSKKTDAEPLTDVDLEEEYNEEFAELLGIDELSE